MTKAEAAKLPFGLYVLRWKSGGASLAAVGNTERERGYAPCNWVAFGRPEISGHDGRGASTWCTDWRAVESVRSVLTVDEARRTGVL